ncbi:MAG: hypothetical protein KDA75_17385 [Planctomycetaceae bacterium]|nr:hypothetical protein [Planctomycetaceae bacterium]
MIHPRRQRMFVFGLCLCSCAIGMATAHNDTFPYTLVRDATTAAKALVEVYTSSDAQLVDEELTQPTVRHRATQDDGSLILVAGGIDFLPDQSRTGHTLAWLMDRSGTVKHAWEYDPHLWNDVERVKTVPLKSSFYPVGLHLEADGDLLVNFQGKDTWPYGVGIAKFDRNSQLLWKRELFNHHWFSVGDDGRIFIPSMRLVDSPYALGPSGAEVRSDDGKVVDDTIMILSPEGELLNEISILECLIENGLAGLFQGATDENLHAFTSDPVHLNDVRVVTANDAAQHGLLTVGDLLISFRSLNAIGLLDPATRQFKWLATGVGLRQHSPRVHDGGILLLDNRGGTPETGGSQLVRVEFDRPGAAAVFPSSRSKPLEHPFYTQVAGHIDLGPGSTSLVTLTAPGEIWEVDLSSGEVLWDYVYVDPRTHAHKPLYTAKYVHDVAFPLNLEQK